MKLSTEQQEKAIALRQLLTTPLPDGETWEPYVDFTRAVAQIIDGFDENITPGEMRDCLQAAYAAHGKYWARTNEKVVLEALDGNRELFDQVKSHPNGRDMINRILARVKEQGGVATIDVTDILKDIE